MGSEMGEYLIGRQARMQRRRTRARIMGEVEATLSPGQHDRRLRRTSAALGAAGHMQARHMRREPGGQFAGGDA